MAGTPPRRGRHGPAPYALGPDSAGWGIVGASRNAAPRFVAAVRALPAHSDGTVQAHIVAIFSHSPFQAHQFAIQASLPHADRELDDLLARRDIRHVYVANHPRHHAESVLAALRAGKQVLCEPPLALSHDEAISLYETARSRGLTLALNYQHRHDPALLLLRRRIAAHDLGDLLGAHLRNVTLLPPSQQTWRVDPAWGGVLFDRALRSVDLVRFVFGEEIGRVTALAGPDVLGHGALEDLHALLTLRSSGAIVHAHSSFLAPHIPSRLDVDGSAAACTVTPLRDHESSTLYSWRSGEAAQSETTAADLWAESVQAYLLAAASGNPPPASAVDDIINMDVCGALRESLRGGAATVPTLQSGLIN